MKLDDIGKVAAEHNSDCEQNMAPPGSRIAEEVEGRSKELNVQQSHVNPWVKRDVEGPNVEGPDVESPDVEGQ